MNINTEIWEYTYDPFGRRLSKERKDKLAWISTEPKRTHFVWDGSRLLQEYNYKGSYTYFYTDQDSYEPLAQVFYNNKDEKQYLAYFHNDQIGIPREMTDPFGNLLWYGEYTAWGKLSKDERIYPLVHQPFRLQNQYHDAETGLHYNFFRYYEPDCGRFATQDPIGLVGGENFYNFAPNVQNWIDILGLNRVPILFTSSTGLTLSVTGYTGLQHLSDSQVKSLAFLNSPENKRPFGKSPVDKKGNTIILHHYKQQSSGPIIAMPERCHREKSKELHPLGNKGGINNREEFNQWKREFWHDQALKELTRRGIKL